MNKSSKELRKHKRIHEDISAEERVKLLKELGLTEEEHEKWHKEHGQKS